MTSPPRIPGARALRPQLLGLLLAGPSLASQSPCIQPAQGCCGCTVGPQLPRFFHIPSGLQMADPLGSPGRAGPSWDQRIRPHPRLRDGAAGLTAWGGARRSSGQHRGRQGGRRGAPSLALHSQLRAPLRALLPAVPLQPLVAAPALAGPARVPRAPPLCNSLTSPAGLPGSV